MMIVFWPHLYTYYLVQIYLNDGKPTVVPIGLPSPALRTHSRVAIAQIMKSSKKVIKSFL